MSSWIDKIGCCAIVGRKESGKTALAYDILSTSTKKVYVLKHPKPKLVEALGYTNMYSVYDFEKISNALIYIDEPQLILQDTKIFKLILSIARHRDITILLSTCDTRWLKIDIEAYIDVWCIKDIDLKLVKRGGMIREIIKESVTISPEGFTMDINEYLFYSRLIKEARGKQVFELPKFWSQELSKPYAK